MSWVAIGVGVTLVTTGVSQASAAKNQRRAGERAAQAQENQTAQQLAFEREQREEIRQALENFSYTQDPTNAYQNLENFYDGLDNRYENLTNYYSDLSNQYQNLPDTYSGLTSRLEGVGPADRGQTAFTDVDNPYAGQQVALESAEFQRQGALQQQANVLDAIQQGGGVTASNVTALQRAGNQQLQQIGAGIEQQELQLQRDFASADFQRQLAVAQGRDRFALETAGAQDQFTLARAASQERLDFAAAQQQYQTAQLTAQQAQQNELLFAGAATRNEQLAIQQQQELDLLTAQQAQQNQLALRQDEVRIQQTIEDRDQSALSAAAAGYSVTTGTNPLSRGLPQNTVTPPDRVLQAGSGFNVGEGDFYQDRFGRERNYFSIV